MSLHTIFPIF